MPGIRELGVYVALTCASVSAMGGTPHLTLDINTQVQARSSNPTWVGTLGNSTYFSAQPTPGAYGAALFSTDGTSDGTVRVKDFAGAGVLTNFLSNLLVYQIPPLFLTAGAKGYFPPTETATGQEVWVTDGTAAGTHIIKDIFPGQGGSPVMLGLVGTDLIFLENVSDSAVQLFRTDGTADGTVQLSNFTPVSGNVGDGYRSSRDPATVNGKVYFGLTNSSGTSDLWVADGTSAGTHQIGGDFPPYPFWGLNPSGMTAFGNSLLFIGMDTSNETTLYKVDTTTDTLQALGYAQYHGYDQSAIAAMDGYALFVGFNSQLWRTDGTSAGTVPITSFASAVSGEPPLGQQDTVITRVNSHAIFLGYGSQTTRSLWSTDGTAAGTVPLLPAPYGDLGGWGQAPLGVVGDYAYIVISTAAGDQIVATDGTVAGTHVLSDIGAVNAVQNHLNLVAGTSALAFIEVLDTATPSNRTVYSYAPQTNTVTKLRQAPTNGQIAQLFYNNGHAFFESTDAVTGDEPWVSDGTVAGTHLLKNVMPESLTNDSHPASLVDFGGKVAFLADDGLNDGVVWVSDGTAAGTTLLPNLTAANNVLSVANLIGANGALYFFGYSGSQYHFMEVGQPGDGPHILADIHPPYISPYASIGPTATVLNGQLYFVGSNTFGSNNLYRTDGTAAGTVAIADVGAPSYLQTVGNKVFFLANTSGGQQLCSIDNSSASATPLSPANNVAFLSGGKALPTIDGTVYFYAYDAGNHLQYWKTDGTAAGTVAIGSSSSSNFPVPVAAVNGKLLIVTVLADSSGYSLSVGDPTNMTLLNTPAVSFYAAITVVGSKAYFAAANANGGFDPWVTDGTQAGTYMLTSVADVQSASAVWFQDFNGVAVFEVTQGSAGSSLFQTDGTQAGTKLIGPIGPQPVVYPPQYSPREHLVIGQNLYFAAVDPSAGAELFVMTNNAPVAVADIASSDKDAAVTLNLLANDTDSDGSINASTLKITTNPTHGSVTVGTGGSVTYTPTAGYSGQDTFAYTVADNQGAVSAPAQVTVTSTVTVSSGGSKGGGGSIGYLDVAFLMALIVQLSSWRSRRQLAH